MREDRGTAVFVLQVNYEWRVLSLFLLMSRLRCTTVFFPWVTHAGKPLATRIMDQLRPANVWRAALNVAAAAVKKLGLVRKFDVAFTAGRMNREAFRDYVRAVNINYVDYDHYLACRAGSRFVPGEYCVFIDEGCVHNPNVRLLGLEEMDPKRFYGALRRFFDHVERSLGLKVVIAAHPGIGYDPGVFGGREIHEGRTCELVRDAGAVISQSSTATSFAVFYGKPLLFVYTDEYRTLRRVSFRILEFLAQELRAQSYNIDLERELAPIGMPVMDRARYDEYKFTSFTSCETQDTSSEGIIIRTLGEL
jgi:hypothetical protein